MTRPRSLRGRLIVTFVGAATVIVLGAAVALAVLMKEAAWKPIDAALREETEALSLAEEVGGPAALATAVREVAFEDDYGDGKKFVRVTGSDGHVITESGTLPGGMEVLWTPPVADRQTVTFDAVKAVYRVASHTSARGHRIEVGVRVAHGTRVLAATDGVIAVTAVAVLAALSLLAWLITTRATAEIEALASELDTLEAHALNRHLTPRGTAEVDHLVAGLNRLLRRLDRAVTHLRRFTADAAHELRTPITVLRAQLEVALSRGPSLEAYREGLLDALEQIERLGCLTEDLLSLSVLEGGRREQDVLSLGSVVREVAACLGPIAEDQARPFSCDVHGEVAVRGSAGLLKRLLLNLVDNALRHTPCPGAVALSLSADDGMAVLVVRDEGPGIPADAVPLLFERFYSRGQTAGSGLGLALCQEIARQHGGSITIESTPGCGTTVTVALPRVGVEQLPASLLS